MKSKRICEGYTQRVIFKNPLGLYGAYNATQMHEPHMQQHMRVPMRSDYDALAAQQAAVAGHYPILAPRPVDPASADYQHLNLSDAGSSQFQYPAPVQFPPYPWLNQPGGQNGPDPRSDSYSQFQTHSTNNWTGPSNQGFAPGSRPPASSQMEDEAMEDELYQEVSTAIFHPYWSSVRADNLQANQPSNVPFQYPQKSGQGSQRTPGQVISLNHSQVFYQDNENEDYYDVESDDEMADQVQAEGFNQLSLIMASANHDDRVRSFTTYLNEPNILATYQPTLGSSPLNNPKTARIFAHFIHSTGPSLSIFERHQTDASVVMGVSVPPSQQGLWTYTIPLKALENTALLQAILAVSSLHIAYLQQTATTVSLKHYHYALKRIGHAVGLPLRRKQIGTLAATQLLAYYEVLAADHTKWNSHLAGAAQLIKEIDYARLTRELRARRRIVSEQRRQMGWSDPSVFFNTFGSDVSEDDPFAEKENSVDEDLISSIVGRAVNFDEFGHVEDGRKETPRHFSRKDIENFRIQCDLYWWFSKQDLFHSLVSGEKLL